MGKFLSTVIGLIIAGIAFGVLWFLIPLVSSVLNASPLYLGSFICGIIFLASFLSMKVFKTRYLKVMPVVLALLFGGITTGVMYDRYDEKSYRHAVLINYNRVYNKFGSEIITSSYSSNNEIRYTNDGTPVIVSRLSYGPDYYYTVYTLEGICIAKNVSNLDGII